MNKPKVISYFSYKGGAGRSTLLYNTVPLLLNEHIKPTSDKPVVLVDMDIDSCGLSYLLEVNAAKIQDNCCVQHVLAQGCDTTARRSIAEADVLKDLIPVGNMLGYADNEAVLFLPAKDNRNVNADAHNNYEDDNFVIHLQSFVDACGNYGVSTIILDSAVGNQATALVANNLARTIVCCMRPTTQFVEGTARYLQKQDTNDATVTGRKKCILVPNVVPQGEVVIDGMRYPDRAINRIYQIFNKFIYGRDEFAEWQYNSDMLDREAFGIPALPRFMWRESQLYTQESLDLEEQVALERYRKLASIIHTF